MNDNIWVAVHVKSRHEFKVLQRLTVSGKEVFLPYYERLNRWKDRKRLVKYPLFSGYLFVKICKSNYNDILSILKTVGVLNILRDKNSIPEVVPDYQINSLKQLVESEEKINPYPYIKEGSKVMVKSGPLQGMTGFLKKKVEQHFFIITIDLLQKGVSVKIDSSDIDLL